MRIVTDDLKNFASKINLAIEKSKINPKAGWVELIVVDENLKLQVANFDYSLEAKIPCEFISGTDFDVTVVADQFIPLISKLDSKYVDLVIQNNALNIKTESNSYMLPLIREAGETKQLDVIQFNTVTADSVNVSDDVLYSIATTNVKGLLESMYSSDIQQFIYMDEKGAITFTENIYINYYKNELEKPFKILLNTTQAKLLKAFLGEKSIKLYVEPNHSYESPKRACIESENIKLTMVVQSQENTDRFPYIRLRELSDRVQSTHVIVDRKVLDKALARLMIFDKKFDATVLNCSKIVFEPNQMKLVSILNNNYEIVPYIRCEEPVDREFIIRFADLVKQIKVITSKEIDISYGETPALVLNSEIKQLIPEVVLE